MGWWKIGESEDENNSGLFNSIPGEVNPNDEYLGDGPADIMFNAIEMIVKEYQDTWGRLPTKNELVMLFEFSLPDDTDEH